MPLSLNHTHTPIYTRHHIFYRRRKFPILPSLMFPSSSEIDFPSSDNSVVLRRAVAVLVFVAAVFFLFNSVGLLRFPVESVPGFDYTGFVLPLNDTVWLSQGPEEYRLQRVLKNAVTKDKTVILTTLNEAWAAPNSIIDQFLESFRLGLHTRGLLNHLVIVALDDKAFRRCLSLHPHCVALVTEGVDFSKEAFFMTPDYLKMMWRRIDFLRSVLEMGYNFVFTDADIMWFRDPFQHFDPDTDFQIACDHYSGDPLDVNNRPNGGFTYVKSNNRSIEFYKFWHSSGQKYPGYHDQDVLNFIKHNPYISEIGLKMRFLDTAYFGGFCEPSKDLNQVCTMHANCCLGMDNKLFDLKILLQDWRYFMSLPPTLKQTQAYKWRAPMKCSVHTLHAIHSPTESEEPETPETDS